jgi:hypothetical protein
MTPALVIFAYLLMELEAVDYWELSAGRCSATSQSVGGQQSRLSMKATAEKIRRPANQRLLY